MKARNFVLSYPFSSYWSWSKQAISERMYVNLATSMPLYITCCSYRCQSFHIPLVSFFFFLFSWDFLVTPLRESVSWSFSSCNPLLRLEPFSVVWCGGWVGGHSMSTDRWTDEETVVHVYRGILLSHEKGTFDPVLMRWKSLEPIIQSEESQKEKNKYVSELIYGI